MDVPRIEQQYQAVYPQLDVDRVVKISRRDSEAAEASFVRSKRSRKQHNDIVRLPRHNPHFPASAEAIGYHNRDKYIESRPQARLRAPARPFPSGIIRNEPSAEIGRDSLEVCEYDMDEQDSAFLGFLVTEFQAPLTCESFEFAMTALELEMFKIELGLPLQPLGVPDEVQACDVCQDSEGQNLNAIIFCDGCDLAVHQDCYGVPFIPDGQWLCRQCQVRRGEPLVCRFCPHSAGAFKQLDTAESRDWGHVVCALWIPELHFGNTTLMEPIQDTTKIPRDRWRLRCSICGIGGGACIQCTHGDCSTSFHATCAKTAGLYMKMTTGLWGALHDKSSMVVNCPRHSPPGWTPNVDTALAVLRAEHQARVQAAQTRNEHAYWRTAQGTMIIPEIVSRALPQYLQARFGIELGTEMGAEIIARICRYWVLKREKTISPFSRRLRTILDSSRHDEVTAKQQLLANREKRAQLEALVQLVEEVRAQTQVEEVEEAEVEPEQTTLTPPLSPDTVKPVRRSSRVRGGGSRS